jgi:hypothetical protein
MNTRIEVTCWKLMTNKEDNSKKIAGHYQVMCGAIEKHFTA